MIFDPIDRKWIFGGFQPSVHSETASSAIFYLWVWKMTFLIFENPGILSTPGWLYIYTHTMVTCGVEFRKSNPEHRAFKRNSGRRARRTGGRPLQTRSRTRTTRSSAEPSSARDVPQSPCWRSWAQMDFSMNSGSRFDVLVGEILLPLHHWRGGFHKQGPPKKPKSITICIMRSPKKKTTFLVETPPNIMIPVTGIPQNGPLVFENSKSPTKRGEVPPTAAEVGSKFVAIALAKLRKMSGS